MNPNRKVYVSRNIVSGTIEGDHFNFRKAARIALNPAGFAYKKLRGQKDHFLKRKVGGTFVGNLLRAGVSSYSGGLLGKGLLMKKAPVSEMPKTDYKTPIAETIAKSTDTAIKNSVANLTQRAKEQLLNGQTSAASLPKTKQIRDAEKVVEKMYDSGGNSESNVMSMSGIKFNPMVIGGVVVGVIILLAVIKKTL